MLEYFLELNQLTDNPDDMRAQTVHTVSHDQEAIIERILKIGAGLTRSDVVSVLEAEKQVIVDILLEGGTVTTEIFNASASIQGVFTGAEDSFDAKRHRVKIHLQEGTALRSIEGKIKTRKLLPQQTGALVSSVLDVKTGSVNQLLTPERNVRINGNKIKIVGEDPAVGLYFINVATGTEVKVDPTDIVENKPASVIAVIPALSPGDYQLRLITQYSGGTIFLKTPHKSDFASLLTVPPST